MGAAYKTDRPGLNPRLLLPVVCALVMTSTSAREIDFIQLELEVLRDRINDRTSEAVETRVRGQVSARVRQSIESTVKAGIDETVTDAVNDSIDEQALTALPAMPGAAPPPAIDTALPPAPETALPPVPDTGLPPLPDTDTVPTEIRDEPDPRARIIEVTPEIDLDRIVESQLARVERELDLAIDTFRDRTGHTALTGEWLVLADETAFAELSREGYEVIHVEELSGLGFSLATVRAPTSYDPAQIASLQVLNEPQIAMDLNHVYLPQRGREQPADAMQGRVLPRGPGRTKIGMIDSSIDMKHRVFTDSRIEESTFTPRGFNRTRQHATAIASILVGKSEAFAGISPDSHLYNGVVFATDEFGREFSTTAAIVRALNWLAENDVTLVNMSLAGPNNAILRKAVESACERGMTLVTAVGNGGPAAAPLFPAAYDCTIGVTAVDSLGKPYHRAGRGDHVDYALPGIDIRHATPGNQFGSSSGTSFAAAVLSGMIGALIPDPLVGQQEIRRRLSVMSADAGVAGRDPVFGQGIIRSPFTAHIAE